MNDVRKRVANLSPAKRALLELKLQKKDTPASKPPAQRITTSALKRVESLSPAKKALLELKLKQKVTESARVSKKFSTGLLRRVSTLSPTKQSLLELKLKAPSAKTTEARAEPPAADLSKRVASLSPVKQALFALKLKQQTVSSQSSVRKFSTGLLRRVSTLSPAKQLLLKQKLAQPEAEIPPTPMRKYSTGLLRRVSNLSPAKQALLEAKVAQKDDSLVQPAQPGSQTNELAQRVANLSPAKQALLAVKLKQNAGETLDTAEQVVSTPAVEPKKFKAAYSYSLDEALAQIDAVEAARVKAEVEAEMRSALPEIHSVVPDAGTADIEDEIETTDWLSDQAEPESPDWLNRAETDDNTTIIVPALPAIAKASTDRMEQLRETPDYAAEGDDIQLTPDWLGDASLEELGTPDWLEDPSEADLQAGIDETLIAPPRLSTKTTSPTEGWLAGLRSSDAAMIDDTGSHTAETTGMLAGLSTLLPAEKVSLPTTEERQPDDLANAAQQFHTIATQAPQPATLPVPLTRQEKFMGNAVKGALLLLFVAIIALPLLPGTQKTANEETGQFIPWTEPTDASSEVLDSQRRQLISEQLGIIDLQQPDSVALVSFDYSTSTQGEMQPLAEAILGRLTGQGMRLITVSLDPEGAMIAQQTIDNALEKRGGEYGVNAVNLGYLPGQAAAVRLLATNETSLAKIVDFKEGVTFNDSSRDTWSDIETLDQVNVIVTLADNPVTARWWIEQLEMSPQPNIEQFLLAGVSAAAEPFVRPYRDSDQLDGLISGIAGAAAIEAGRNTFGPARQMIDSLSIAHLIIVILIAAGTVVAWMPKDTSTPPETHQENEQNTPDEKEL